MEYIGSIAARHAYNKIQKVMITKEKTHPILGNLHYDQYLNWYECKVPFRGAETDIFISLDNVENEITVIEQAYEFYRNIEKWNGDAEIAIIRNLLEEINSGWLHPENRQLVSEADLLKQLTLTGVTILVHNCFDMCYKVGDLLGGHSILVSGTIIQGIKSVDIVG